MKKGCDIENVRGRVKTNNEISNARPKKKTMRFSGARLAAGEITLS
jgi:hypothetical protein